ncbi:tetratricopeptide repeat protein [Geopsychrobacter electrodiphilus]|uniref:tetratricopeptide repeat protein n=1 Tax=Geopsychrobacter electrodiphilus TaxID=225196 RepID=UPI0003669269|nr:tetratricopeptide repeat protein [Geopsychrobacter electrodiphilus]
MSLISILLLGLSLLSGCVSLITPPNPGTAGLRRPYLSEIDLPEAKAFFGYAQFRLLIVENRWDEAISALERAQSFDPQSEWLRMTLAKAYLHNQQFVEGGEALETLLADHPENSTGWALLGELRSYQERYADAVQAYTRVLQLDPGNENIRLRLIAVYDLQKDLPRALAATRELLALNPDSVAGRLTLARLQREGRQTDEAIKTYRDLLVRRPGQLQTILELGQLLEKEQQVGEAITLYRESIKDNPELLAVYRQLARILILQERYDEALTLLQQAHRQRPEDLQILNRMGLLQLSREDYQGAEETFRQILDVQPDLPRALYSLGLALIGQQRNADALAALKRIPKTSDIYSEAVLQLGYLYRAEGDLEQGIQILQQAVDGGSQGVDVYYYLSSFLGEVGRYAAAGQTVRAGLKLFPQESRLHYQLGVIYERMDDHPQALAEMQMVLTLDPQNADALNFIAYHYAEQGENLEQALAQAKLALEQKKSSYIYDTLGWIYYRMERYTDARENLDKAVALDSRDPLILEHLGDILVAQKLWAEAEKTYRKVLELNKTSASVERKLQQLLKDHSLR